MESPTIQEKISSKLFYSQNNSTHRIILLLQSWIAAKIKALSKFTSQKNKQSFLFPVLCCSTKEFPTIFLRKQAQISFSREREEEKVVAIKTDNLYSSNGLAYSLDKFDSF
jgi:hypothetical protein